MNDALVNFRDLVVHNIEHCDGEDLVIPEELCIDLMTTIIRLRDLAKPKFLNEPVTSLEHKSILTEAEGLVHGDRNESYGHPLDYLNRT